MWAGLGDLRAELPLDPLAPAQAVAMLAARRRYSRTRADASSAIARILRAPPSGPSGACQNGPHMQVPTEAWAYQVPRLPCLWNTSCQRVGVFGQVLSGTAQSSMKLTGLPSPFRLIMMFRPPCVLPTGFLRCVVGHAHHRVRQARSPISSTSRSSWAAARLSGPRIRPAAPHPARQ